MKNLLLTLALASGLSATVEPPVALDPQTQISFDRNDAIIAVHLFGWRWAWVDQSAWLLLSPDKFAGCKSPACLLVDGPVVFPDSGPFRADWYRGGRYDFSPTERGATAIPFRGDLRLIKRAEKQLQLISGAWPAYLDFLRSRALELSSDDPLNTIHGFGSWDLTVSLATFLQLNSIWLEPGR